MSTGRPLEESPAKCDLCGLPVDSEPVQSDAVEGGYCCRGCLTVAERFGSIPPVDETDSKSVPPDASTAYIAVDGMHCTTCEAFLEHRAKAADGVYGASASYATDTVRIDYDSDRVDTGRLTESLTGYGYRAREAGDGRGDSDDGALVRFLVGGGLFGMMVMLWYVLFIYPVHFGFPPVVSLGPYDSLYIYANVWVMTSFVLFYTGLPILRGAIVSLRVGLPNMDLLVAIAALSAYVYSTTAMVLGRMDLYFDVTVAIILVVTASSYYENRVKRRAASLVADLADQQVESVRLAESDTEVPRESVSPGAEILVRLGERIPLDGTVREGTAAIDESLVSGESRPRTVRPGDRVRGGTVCTDAPLVVEVGPEAASTMDRLLELLWETQSDRSGAQRLADRLATIFVPLVVGVAVVVGAAWFVMGGAPNEALLVSLTVVIVSCPCALGVATPLAIASGVQSAAERGIVITSDALFESTTTVDTVVLDKTGTLTERNLAVQAVHGDDPDRTLEVAAALEASSAHPLARTICEAAGRSTLRSEDIEIHDRGVTGTVQETRAAVGHPAFLEAQGYDPRPGLEAVEESALPVAVGWDGAVRGVIAIDEQDRSGWAEVVSTLGRDRRLIVLTGDDRPTATRYRDHGAVDEVITGVPPDGKAATIQRLQRDGSVAMVGDGSNDAPALAAADLGIAIGGGTALAADAADVVLVEDDLELIEEVIRLAQATRGRIRGNLAWAFSYNAVAIPLAAAGVLNPLFAALAMASSSLGVVLNSARTLTD